MTLRFETLRLPGAPLGTENPLPPLRILAASREGLKQETFPPDTWTSLHKGELSTLLPYMEQNAYGRQREMLELPCAVLENDQLRAMFLPSLGGRLWSLYHKGQQRELLYSNPVLQPANLALRNAWFSGGVEWNIGMIGHSPHTMSPLFTAEARGADGQSVLRMWEWERIRQLTYHLDFWLQGELLLCGITITNPQPHEVPVYWWSNIAVPQTATTRVLAPAPQAIKIDYAGSYLLQDLPHEAGVDLSYPAASTDASDYFFDIPDGRQPWITALDLDGKGLFQTSTARLRGRKLFTWGNRPGGETWQTFLSVPGSPYLEIQAGLSRTQLEYGSMPARGELRWLEAYGLLEVDAAAAHHSDWQTAFEAAGSKVSKAAPAVQLEEWFQAWQQQSTEFAGLQQAGSPWGPLEACRRQHQGQPLLSPHVAFPHNCVTGEATPWLALLDRGEFPGGAGFQTQQEWLPLLLEARTGSTAAEAERLLHVGMIHYAQNRFDEAAGAWEASRAAQPGMLAARNLAQLWRNRQQHTRAITFMREAWLLSAGERDLALELVTLLFEAAEFAACLEFVRALPLELRRDGRIRVCEARVALRFGLLAEARKLLAADLVVPDIREGEALLEVAWTEYAIHSYAQDRGLNPDPALAQSALLELPLPGHLDFRMHRRPVVLDSPLCAADLTGEELMTKK